MSSRPWRFESSLIRALCGCFVATVAAAYYGLITAFSSFAPYDDEGYFLLNIRRFLAGERLFDDMEYHYGPFFYYQICASFELLGAEATSDSARLYTVSLWLACALIAAALVWRTTHNTVVTVAALLGTCASLYPVLLEPAHPQVLCFALSIGLPACLAWTMPRYPIVSCVFAGLTAGALLMSKINLGIFATAAVAVWIASQLGGRFGRAARLVSGIGVILAPSALMWRHLTNPHVAVFAALCTFAAGTAVLLHTRGGDDREFSWRHAAAATAAAASVVAACYVAFLARGVSTADFVGAVLLRFVGFGSSWNMFSLHGPVQLVEAGVGFGACLVLAVKRPTGERVELLVAVAQIVFAVSALMTVVVFPNPDQAGWIFGWLWLVAAGDLLGSKEVPSRASRRLLVALAATSALQAYPVSGTQAWLATALAAPIAAICGWDGVRTLRSKILIDPIRTRSIVAVLMLLLASSLAIGVYRARDAKHTYDTSIPLDLPGARRLRLPERQVARYRWLSANLSLHGDTFLSNPGLSSFYVWTEMTPPTPWNLSAWPAIYGAGRQSQIVAEVADVPRLLAIQNLNLSAFWRAVSGDTPMPLEEFLTNEFVPLASFDGYDLLVRRSMGHIELTYVGELDASGRLVLRLPALGERSIRRIVVFDCGLERVVADTDAGELSALIADSEPPEGLPPLRDRGIDVRRMRTVTLPLASQSASLSDAVIVRLFDESGEMFALVPVVH